MITETSKTNSFIGALRVLCTLHGLEHVMPSSDGTDKVKNHHPIRSSHLTRRMIGARVRVNITTPRHIRLATRATQLRMRLRRNTVNTYHVDVKTHVNNTYGDIAHN